MLKNEKQLQVTKNRLDEFLSARDEISDDKQLDPIVKEIQINALNSQIQDFNDEIIEYEKMKAGLISEIKVSSISNVQQALVQARIIKGFTQAELAQRMSLKEQQIQRYEANSYSTASILRIAQVAKALDLQIEPFNIRVKEPNFKFINSDNQHVIRQRQEQIKESKTLFEFA